MKQELIDLLETFEYPVRLQGSLASENDYPVSFFTFWNNTSDDGNHYDNNPVSIVWNFTVNFYSVNPALVESVTESAIDLLKTNGWIISGHGSDVPSGTITHTGRSFDALYLEYRKEENE